MDDIVIAGYGSSGNEGNDLSGVDASSKPDGRGAHNNSCRYRGCPGSLSQETAAYKAAAIACVDELGVSAEEVRTNV